MTMSAFTIYHNPDCGTSRKVLAHIRAAGIEPTVIEYLKNPPGRTKLVALMAAMGISVRELLRRKGAAYDELNAALNLDHPARTDADLLDAMLAHPILMNRPVVVGPQGTRLCRPSDTVLQMLG